MQAIEQSLQTVDPTELIRRDYHGMWVNARSRLAEGRIQPDPGSKETIKKWGLSAVLSPTGNIADTLVGVADELAVHTGRSQVVYDHTDLHTTLRSIEFHQPTIATDKVQTYTDILHEVAQGYGPFSVSYRGLTATPTGVLAQGWPDDDSLQNLRLAFHRRLESYGLLSGPETIWLRVTAHASLVVFASSLLNPLSLVRYVEGNKHTNYGTAIYNSIDLVYYNRTRYHAGLVRVGRVALGS